MKETPGRMKRLPAVLQNGVMAGEHQRTAQRQQRGNESGRVQQVRSSAPQVQGQQRFEAHHEGRAIRQLAQRSRFGDKAGRTKRFDIPGGRRSAAESGQQLPAIDANAAAVARRKSGIEEDAHGLSLGTGDGRGAAPAQACQPGAWVASNKAGASGQDQKNSAASQGQRQ